MTLSGKNVSGANRSDMKRPDMGRRWIAANVIPSAFIAVALLAVYLIGKAMGVPGSGASLPAQAIYVALETVVIATGLTLYAQMTAPVLATNIPAFPYRAWTVMHLTLGVALGFLSGLVMLEVGDAEPVQWSDWTELAILLLLMIVLSCVIAAFFGGLQALVLRRVAIGLGAGLRSGSSQSLPPSRSPR
jgi:hypothetical protein